MGSSYNSCVFPDTAVPEPFQKVKQNKKKMFQIGFINSYYMKHMTSSTRVLT